MKKITIIILGVLLFAVSCKTTDSVSKTEEIAQITEKIESMSYTFVPQRAIPMSGTAVNLNYSFSLKVSRDSINSYLPYYGRAYTAPSPIDGGAIKFISTDFDYSVTEKKNEMWDISIKLNDNQRRYNMILNVGKTGSASLTVRDNQRQSITFYGKIE